MRKIAVFLTSLANKGPIIVAENIAKKNNDGDFEFVFISLRKNKNSDLERFKNFKVYELNNNKFNFGKNNIKRLIKNINPDIIHCHNFWPTILSGLYLKKYKIVTTLHNNPLEDYTYEYGIKVGRIMTNLMLYYQKKFQKNIAISEYIKKVHLDLKIPMSKLTVIYNGVDTKNRSLLDKNNKIGDKCKLLTVSVLNKCKNVEFLIKVAFELKKSDSNFVFKIIGKGPEMENLKKMVKEFKLENMILFLGEKTKEEVSEVMKDSNVFIFSSLSEGFGLVVAEALVNGLPVIVPKIPVMMEIVKDGRTGYICDYNVEEYVRQLKKIIDNFEWFKLNVKKENYNKFIAENMSKNYIKIYKEVMQND